MRLMLEVKKEGRYGSAREVFKEIGESEDGIEISQ
jgi:hypothetical protein